MRRILLAVLLACAAAAQAETRALVVATDPPGEAIALGRDEVLWLRIAYITDEPVRRCASWPARRALRSPGK